MEENIKKAIKEITVIRDGLTLRARGFEVFGSFDSHYIFLTIHLSQGEKIKIDKIRVAKEIKDCLITRRASTICEESQSDETISYTHYNFIFGDDGGVQLIRLEGEKYPIIESLQPKPTKTEFYINSAESIAVIVVIEQFLILQEKYYANKSTIEKKITEYLEKQKREDDEFISGLAKKLNLDPTDVSLIFKDKKESFPLFFWIMHNSE